MAIVSKQDVIADIQRSIDVEKTLLESLLSQHKQLKQRTDELFTEAIKVDGGISSLKKLLLEYSEAEDTQAVVKEGKDD